VEKVKVRLLQLGSLPVSLTKVVQWKSGYFEIDTRVYQKGSLPNSDGEGWSYSKKLLNKIVGKGAGADITVGIIDKPIEGNYYLHRLTDKTCVLSLYQMTSILAAENIPVDLFIIRNLYEMVCLYYEFGEKLSSGAYSVHHEDTRGCLYDFNAIKTDIVASTKQVGLCVGCKARLSKTQLPQGFVAGFERELKRLKKPLVYAAIGFVKEHPYWSLLLSTLFGLVLNVAANIVYAVWLKRFFE
jgi:hypothetical protein